MMQMWKSSDAITGQAATGYCLWAGSSHPFTVLAYLMATQILFVNLSKDLGIDLNVPADPEFHKKMDSKLEAQ